MCVISVLFSVLFCVLLSVFSLHTTSVLQFFMSEQLVMSPGKGHQGRSKLGEGRIYVNHGSENIISERRHTHEIGSEQKVLW